MLKAFHTYSNNEAGCDEAGRGCLAGPVTAAAVILPENYSEPLLQDSKKLSATQRDKLRIVIEKNALAYSVVFIDNQTIDEINILQSTFKAINQAVISLPVRPSLLLIDGHIFINETSINHHCIITGDGLYQNIAAASILAKTYRDEYMMKIHGEFPHYNWAKNKGYATKEHLTAIHDHGVSPYHRLSFNMNTQLKLF